MPIREDIMNLFASCTLVGIIVINAMAISAAYAQSTVTPYSQDHRIKSLLFVPDQVVRLRAWVGYHIDLEFEPGESFRTLGGGDLAGLTYGAFENHLVLKPRAPMVRTNLTVITNKRTYIIDYVVLAGRPDPMNDELVYSLRFNYPLSPSA